MSIAERTRFQEDLQATSELLRLAAPIVAMMVSRMAMTFIDFVMVSQLGTEAQAAISPASIFVFMVACVGMGIAHGVQTFVSQADGRGAPQQAGAYAWQSFYIAAIGQIVMIPVLLTTEIWFSWIAALGQHPPAVEQMEVDYIRISLWAVAPSIICIGLNGFFNGVQRPNITFLAVLASLIANVIGNWLLIYGNLGFPAMGISGAAVSTTIAWCVRATVLLIAMLQPYYHERYATRSSFPFSRQKMKGLLKIGAPTSVQWIVDIGSWSAFMTLIVPLFGTVAMAATNVGLQYMHLSFMPAIGIGIALCSQVGYAIGAGDPDKATQRTRVAFGLTVAYMGVVGILFFVLREPLMRLFNDDPDVVSAGSWVLIFAAIFQVFDAMSITYINALRGAGDTRYPAVITALCCWVVFIGGGYAIALLAPQLGLTGPWAMCTLYITLLGLLLWLRWKHGAWRRISIFEEREPAAAPMGYGEPAFEDAEIEAPPRIVESEGASS